MITKGILKNLNKYNNIKLVKGINLGTLETKPRSLKGEKVGISTKSFGNRWFVTPKGKAIFKSFDSEFGVDIKDIRIVNELLCKQLCNQINLDCAEYEIASINNLTGLLSYDIVGNNRLINLSEFIKVDKNARPNLIDCANCIDIYKNNGVNINKKEVIINLYKIILFDTLTLQTDRNARNINFIYDKKSKTLTTAKLIDNEFAFCGERMVDWLENNYGEMLSMRDVLYEYSNLGKIFTFDSDYILTSKQFKNNVENLIAYAKKYPDLQNVLDSTLNNLNVKDAFKKVEKTGIKINNDYKNYVLTLVENVKNELLQEKQDSKLDIEFLENIY